MSEGIFAARPTVAERCDGRDNNFNLIRLLAAGAVLVSHATPITLGPLPPEPLEPLIGRSLGWAAVAVFFCISGFLIARSFERAPGVETWAAARIMRLFPGLLAATVLCAFALGPLVTTLPAETYFSDPAVWTYAPRNLALVSLQYELPGVFDAAPYPGAVNGSLWTLVHEVACYMGVLAMGLAGALRDRRRAAVAVGLWALVYLGLGASGMAAQIHPKLAPLRELSLPYMLGVICCIWRDRIPLDWRLAGLLVVPAMLAAPFGAGLFEPLLILALVYAVFCAAWLPRGALLRFNRLGDYSYGLYIYAFPTQQAAVHLFGPMSPLENVAIALPVTLLLSVLSWRLVEKPALERRGVLAALLARPFRRRAT